MYNFVVETSAGKEVHSFSYFMDAKKEFDKYLNGEKECISITPLVKQEIKKEGEKNEKEIEVQMEKCN